MQQTLDRQFTQMSEEAYGQLKGERSTMLKKVLLSPKHYHHAQQQGVKETEPMRVGTLAHAMLFEPNTLEQRFAVLPAINPETGKKMTKRGKVWDAFEQQAGDRTVVKEVEWHQCAAWVKALHADTRVAALLAHGKPECAAQWDDWGVTLKARYDWLYITDDTVICMGLKTAVSCAPRYFAAQSAKLGYPLSWAQYFRGLEKLLPGRAIHMFEVVVEKTAPFDVAVYRITDDVLLTGQAHLAQAIETLRKCREQNTWEGQAPGITDLDLPAWATGVDSLELEVPAAEDEVEDAD